MAEQGEAGPDLQKLVKQSEERKKRSGAIIFEEDTLQEMMLGLSARSFKL